MNEIKILTETTIEDYIEYNFYVGNKVNKLKLQYNFLLVLGIFFVVMGFLSSTYSSYWFLILVIGLTVVAYRFIHPELIKRKIRNTVKESPKLIGKSVLTIDQHRIFEVDDHSTTTIKLSEIYSFEETNTTIYIFFTKLQAFIIRKSILSSEELKTLKSWILESKQT